jgi:hypothetical protein
MIATTFMLLENSEVFVLKINIYSSLETSQLEVCEDVTISLRNDIVLWILTGQKEHSLGQS